MLSIREFKDLSKIQDNVHRQAIQVFFKNIMENLYKDSKADDIGWIIYIEKDDNLLDNEEFGLYKKQNGIYFEIFEGAIGWEAVEKFDGLYIVTVILNNDFAYTYFIPDETWLDPILKKTLEDHCIGELTILGGTYAD